MNNPIYTRFDAKVVVEGSYSSTAQAFNPSALLELALQHALFSMPAGAVSDLVRKTTASMLHSLSCKRRGVGELVRLVDDDPDGYNGVYQIAAECGESNDCIICGNPLCKEWPTLFELTPEGERSGDFAYHVSECQMLDPQRGDQLTGANVLLAARRIIEKRIIIAAAEGLVAEGCSVSVVEGETVFIADSTEPVAIEAALHASGKPGFWVKRTIDGIVRKGWVDFVGSGDIEVTADDNLELDNALAMANTLAAQLRIQPEPECPLCGCPVLDDAVLDEWNYFHCHEHECGARLNLDERGRARGYQDNL
ncbi:hypothetical protein RYA05_00565 [Pseudomonas syringae pv. actinidiae]|nr:hypothetical protein [Pseudomonas syringae pv. actinidiae]